MPRSLSVTAIFWEAARCLRASTIVLGAKRGFRAADRNGNSHLTIREAYTYLGTYDTGNPGQPRSAGDKAVTGAEWVRLMSYYGEKPQLGAIEQTSAGAWLVKFLGG